MRVLGRARQACQILARDELLELEPKVFPRGRESVASAAEELVGEVGSAERGEAREPLLLVRASVAALGFNRGEKPDRGEIVCRPALPGLGELAIANEAIVIRWTAGAAGAVASSVSGPSGSVVVAC
jgi:hypothetical protein